MSPGGPGVRSRFAPAESRVATVLEADRRKAVPPNTRSVRVASLAMISSSGSLAGLEFTSSRSSLGAKFLPLPDGGTPQRLVLASAHICFSG